MKRISTILLFIMLLSFSAMAQQAIHGLVLDAADDSPIPGASVIVAGSKSGTATDADGKFVINAKIGQTLKITYIGMRPVSQVIKSDNIEIRMESDSKVLEEVVAVGYGVTKKRDLAGSIASIKPENIQAGVIVNTAELIKGRAAGVHADGGETTGFHGCLAHVHTGRTAFDELGGIDNHTGLDVLGLDGCD